MDGREQGKTLAEFREVKAGMMEVRGSIELPDYG